MRKTSKRGKTFRVLLAKYGFKKKKKQNFHLGQGWNAGSRRCKIVQLGLESRDRNILFQHCTHAYMSSMLPSHFWVQDLGIGISRSDTDCVVFLWTSLAQAIRMPV